MSVRVRPLEPADRAWLVRVLTTAWASPSILCLGRLVDASALPGLVAELDGRPAAALTYRVEGDACEIVSLNSEIERRGAASALLTRAAEVAREAGCRRLWLTTTNDNLPALRFYQKRGFALVAIHRDAITEGRRLKPSIPLLGLEGIPIRDEIELEIALR